MFARQLDRCALMFARRGVVEHSLKQVLASCATRPDASPATIAVNALEHVAQGSVSLRCYQTGANELEPWPHAASDITEV